jgi:hypothetical protein
MNIKIKWFIHKYYFVIAISTLLFVVLLAPLLYLKGADWKIPITVIGGLSSFFFFIQKQELEEAKFINELLVKFNARYDSMNEKLNAIVKKNTISETMATGDIKNLFDYFNLCGEEYLFYRRGYIYPEVWKSWVAGMKFYYNDPRIQNLWEEELSSESYYGLDISKEIERLELKA